MPGTTNFPTSLDTANEVDANTQENEAGKEHDTLHNNLDARTLAIEAKVGINGSEDTNSLDFKVAANATALAAKAPLASPTFTGTPAAPTPSSSDNSTTLATTAFVQDIVATAVTGLLDLKGSLDASGNPNYAAASKGDVYLITVAGKVGGASGKAVDVGDAVIASADNAGGAEASVGASWFVLEHNLAGVALLASPAFTGTPTAPTPAFGDDSTKLATTEFVQGAVAAGGGGGGSVATDAIFDAAGDLVVGTGSNTAARLAVGADGKILKVVAGMPVWADETGGGGGGAAIDEGAYASVPGAPAEDDVYLVTDAPVLLRRGASTWSVFGPVWKFTSPPALGSLSWVNQGGASAGNNGPNLYLRAPYAAGANARCLVKSLPAAPYTVTVAMLRTGTSETGIVLRNSSTGAMLTFGLYAAASPQLYLGTWSSATSASVASTTNVPFFGGVIFLRVVDDNTNRSYQISSDGFNFVQIFSHARTTHTTPDQWGVYVNAADSPRDTVLSVLSWTEV